MYDISLQHETRSFATGNKIHVMETIYLCIVIFLFVLAVFDLIVGVSNDAVNFLQSAVGAKAASFKTVKLSIRVGSKSYTFSMLTSKPSMIKVGKLGLFSKFDFES